MINLTAVASKLDLSPVWQNYHHTSTTRGRAVAARVAHNHKVAGSSPAPATKKKDSSKRWVFFLGPEPDSVLRQRFSKGKYRSGWFGGARTRTGVYSEHTAAKKCFWQSQKCALSCPRYQN